LRRITIDRGTKNRGGYPGYRKPSRVRARAYRLYRQQQHLCEQLHVAVRLKGTEALPPNARDIGFDTACVKTVLLSGLRLAGVTVQNSIEAAEEPPWS
jgi:hypothetical protein